MSLPLYPPFSDADLRSPTLDYEAIPDAVFDKAKVIRHMQTIAHGEGRHELRRHPWCSECEFRDVAEDVQEFGIELLTPAQMDFYRSEVKRVGAASALEIVRETHGTEPEKAADLEWLAEEIRSITAKRYTPETYAAMLRIAQSEAIYADYEISDIARNVSDRIKAHLWIYGKPPADNYDPERDGQPKRLRVLSPNDLDELPDLEWLAAGFITRHAYCVLRGRDETYKTFIGLDFAACIGTGHPWQGRPVSQGRVLYVAGEGANGIGKRLWAWRLRNVNGRELTADEIQFIPQGVDLAAGGDDLEQLLDTITEGKYALVVIDTLNKCSGDADVNGPQANAILRSIERIKRATADGSVLVLAHTGKSDEDVRGWSGFEDDADIVWHSRADQDGVTLANTKMKEAARSPKMRLAVVPILEADSLVLEQVEGPRSSSNLTDSQRQLLETLCDAFGTSSATKRELHEATGLPRSTFYHALNALKRSGDVIVEGKGDRAIYSLSSNAVQQDEDGDSLTNSNPSNVVQIGLDDPAVSLSKSSAPIALDIGQNDHETATA